MLTGTNVAWMSRCFKKWALPSGQGLGEIEILWLCAHCEVEPKEKNASIPYCQGMIFVWKNQVIYMLSVKMMTSLVYL